MRRTPTHAHHRRVGGGSHNRTTTVGVLRESEVLSAYGFRWTRRFRRPSQRRRHAQPGSHAPCRGRRPSRLADHGLLPVELRGAIELLRCAAAAGTPWRPAGADYLAGWDEEPFDHDDQLPETSWDPQLADVLSHGRRVSEKSRIQTSYGISEQREWASGADRDLNWVVDSAVRV